MKKSLNTSGRAVETVDLELCPVIIDFKLQGRPASPFPVL